MKRTKKLLVGILATLSVLSGSLGLAACDLELSLGNGAGNQNSSNAGEEAVAISEGLAYELLENDTYAVVGIGDCMDTEIVIPSNYNDKAVTSISDQAFAYRDSLTSVTIRGSVTSIGNGAFYDCNSLTSVVIGKGVTSIGVSAFSDCEILTEIKVNENNTAYRDIDGNLYTKDGATLIQYAIGKTNPSFTIPDSVTTIGDGAFFRCNSLTSVTIPGSVTTIERGAFWCCSSLTSVEIPDSVTSIGEAAFYSCDSLTNVIIGNSVTSIEFYTFYACESLTNIVIGDSVTSIGESALTWCEKLMNITVGENNSNLKSIDGNLYTKDGTTLIQYSIGKTDTSFVIPDSVTTIGESAFSWCTSLTSIEIPDRVTSLGNNAFSQCTSLTSIEIPDRVTSIGYNVFGSCSSLTSVEIPDSVTSIGDHAFYDCDSLTSITFNGTVEEWNAISKGDNWNNGVPATKVVCSDGEVFL